MPFAVAAAGIGAAATIGGSMMQSSAAGKAASQSKAALDQQRSDLAPYRAAGDLALPQQNALLGLSGQDAADAAMTTFQASPGYQYQVQQGLRAVDAGAASRGYLRSGATIKAEETLGSNLANQGFGEYYNRLMGLTTLGANAAAGGAQPAIQASKSSLDAGNAQSSIYGNEASGLGGIANNLLSNKDFQGLFKSGPASSFGPPGSMPNGMGSGVPSMGAGGTMYNSGGIF